MHPDLEPRALGRRLRALPDPQAAPYDWGEFERRCRERAHTAQRRSGGRAVAAAAVLALGILALWIRLGGGSPGVRPPGASPDAARVAVEPLRTEPDNPAPSGAHSASMERWLETLPNEPAVVRVGTHVAVTGLEDRIAQLDDLLSVELLDESRPARLLALEQERTRLVGTLLQVRYAETLADASR